MLDIIGGASRDRTDDLLTASQALSQLSYNPEILIVEKRHNVYQGSFEVSIKFKRIKNSTGIFVANVPELWYY